jgi:hypothetical protein
MPDVDSFEGQVTDSLPRVGVGAERRSFPRRLVRLGVTVYGGDTPDPAHCLDIGAGGVRLETPHRLEVGGVPTLVLSIPGSDAMMLSAEVLETWEDGGGWVCRLAFRDVRPRDRQRLGAFVDGAIAIRPGEG